MPRYVKGRKSGSGVWPFLAGLVGMLIVGWVVFPMLLYSEKPQPINFSHFKHGGEVDLTCDQCHSFRPDGTFTGIPKIAKCKECHEIQNSESPDEAILIHRYLETGTEIPWRVYARQPICVYLSHVFHVKTAKLECKVCHGPKENEDKLRPYEENRITGYSRDIWGRRISGIKTHSWDRMKMDDCAECHRKNGVNDHCFVCHK